MRKKKVGYADGWCLGEKKRKQNENNKSSSYAKPRSNKRVEINEVIIIY